MPPRARVPLLVLGFAALAFGIAGGLVRLGSAIPAPAGAIALHGALMVSGFLGTVIGLERAVALLDAQGRLDAGARAQAARARAMCEAARLLCYRIIDARVKGLPPGAETNLARINLVNADRLVSEFIGDHLMDALMTGEDPIIAGAYRRTAATGIASGTAEMQLHPGLGHTLSEWPAATLDEVADRIQAFAARY